MIKLIYWDTPLASTIPYEVLKSGLLLYNSFFLYISITNTIYVFDEDFVLKKMSFTFFCKSKLTSVLINIIIGCYNKNQFTSITWI